MRWRLTGLKASWRSLFLVIDYEGILHRVASQPQHKSGNTKTRLGSRRQGRKKCLISHSPDPGNDITNLFHNTFILIHILMPFMNKSFCCCCLVVCFCWFFLLSCLIVANRMDALGCCSLGSRFHTLDFGLGVSLSS